MNLELTAVATPADTDQLQRLDAYWRAANYLSVGQIYLLDNPLLREPLRLEHVKPRLLGHWGTTPGLNFIYAHLNRLIRARDLNVLYVTGPGHGGPGASRQHVPGGDLQRGLPAYRPRRGKACAGCSGSSRSRAGFRATSRPRLLVRSTRAASWATRWSMPTVPRSTTRTCWCAASSETARPRPGRWPRAGIRTSSSTRRRWMAIGNAARRRASPIWTALDVIDDWTTTVGRVRRRAARGRSRRLRGRPRRVGS